MSLCTYCTKFYWGHKEVRTFQRSLEITDRSQPYPVLATSPRLRNRCDSSSCRAEASVPELESSAHFSWSSREQPFSTIQPPASLGTEFRTRCGVSRGPCFDSAADLPAWQWERGLRVLVCEAGCVWRHKGRHRPAVNPLGWRTTALSPEPLRPEMAKALH